MLEQAITEIQNIERSVARKTLSDLQIRLALRSCVVRRVPPAAREQLGHLVARLILVRNKALARRAAPTR